MEKIMRLIALFVLTTIMACQKNTTQSPIDGKDIVVTPPRTVVLTDTLTIKMGETVASGNFSIKLDSITNDSRCPMGFNCIWEGSADAKLIVKKDNNSQTIKLTSVPITPILRDTATVFSHLIKFISVAPPTKSGVQVQQNEYVIKLLVN
jgi:hypothetical protein